MCFADFYFNRYKTSNQFFINNDDPKLGIIVCIPCYDDGFIFETLDSLNKASSPRFNVEVIIVVNSSSDVSEEVLNFNRHIYNDLLQRAESKHYSNFNLFAILLEGISPKVAGVGHARKVAMDEAIRRFNHINNPDGLILSLDADAIVDPDYFTYIEDYFILNPSLGAASLQFVHNYKEVGISKELISACKLYEIYLRYFRLSLKYANFPYPFHTIGSCFVVKASVYVKAGGMSQRQGGEDFYFLHKLLPIAALIQINKALVFPSPRISNRVPFGTGPSVKRIVDDGEYKVYNFKLFLILKKFYNNIENFEDYPKEIINFYTEEKCRKIIADCKKNTASKESFIKRMYRCFDAFFIVKFLNSFDDKSEFPKMNVLSQASDLFETIGHEPLLDLESVYDKILELDINN